tara:strand:- start:2549 stop:2890 length:342 start_codon:yes stop_codon:yes gene_type:complete
MENTKPAKNLTQMEILDKLINLPDPIRQQLQAEALERFQPNVTNTIRNYQDDVLDLERAEYLMRIEKNEKEMRKAYEESEGGREFLKQKEEEEFRKQQEEALKGFSASFPKTF